MNGSRDRRRKSEPDWQTIRQCYEADTGRDSYFSDRAYMDWCEAKVNKWAAMVEAMGHTMPCFEIRTLTGSITYHEWLKREVGL